jgi:beta-lactamase class A
MYHPDLRHPPLGRNVKGQGAGRRARPQSRRRAGLVYALRMLILSVGVGVLAGTMLSVWDPATRLTANNTQQSVQPSPSPSPTPDAAAQLTAQGQEIRSLKVAIQGLAVKTPQLAPGVFLLDLDNNAYLDLGGGTLFSSASTIKLAILIAVFQDIDQGKIRLEEMLTLQQAQVAKGSGDMQFLTVGTRVSVMDAVTQMIITSDNTATNMVIDRIGGKDVLNQRFQSWGLTATVLNNRLPDLDGTNTTSAKELVWLLAQIHQGKLVGLTSRDRILDILNQTVSADLLPSGIGTDARIGHKTGTLGGLLADAGIVSMANGKRYAIAVLVKRPFQDEAAAELIRQISRTTYDYLVKPPMSADAAAAIAPNPR